MLACPGNKELMSLEMKFSLECDGTATNLEEKLAGDLANTKLIADDVNDSRRGMAAGDYGSYLAVGTKEVKKDVVLAEKYLLIGAELNDIASIRNLAFLYLDLNRVEDCMKYLNMGSELGDEECTASLKTIVKESETKKEEMIAKLRIFAAQGDERAIAMLKELNNGTLGTV